MEDLRRVAATTLPSSAVRQLDLDRIHPLEDVLQALEIVPLRCRTGIFFASRQELANDSPMKPVPPVIRIGPAFISRSAPD